MCEYSETLFTSKSGCFSVRTVNFRLKPCVDPFRRDGQGTARHLIRVICLSYIDNEVDQVAMDRSVNTALSAIEDEMRKGVYEIGIDFAVLEEIVLV